MGTDVVSGSSAFLTVVVSCAEHAGDCWSDSHAERAEQYSGL